MNCLRAATKPSGVYCASAADSSAWTLASFFPANSPAAAATPPPSTAASNCHPLAAAMACPAAMVSHETRFSLPCCCSATTSMVSGIVLYVRLHLLPHADKNHHGAGDRLRDLPAHEEKRSFANIAAHKQQQKDIEQPEDEPDGDQRGADIFLSSFFFFVLLAFLELHGASLSAPNRGQQRRAVLAAQSTRTSFRRRSTSFLATSVGGPSSISVFLLFCGMYSFSILI